MGLFDDYLCRSIAHYLPFQTAHGQITTEEVRYFFYGVLGYADTLYGRLDERWGAETSAKGGRFKLNRDFGGYHLTARGAIVIDEGEPPVKVTVDSPEKLRTAGNLVHMDNLSFRYPKAEKPILEGVTFTVEQGGRCAFVGAVSPAQYSIMIDVGLR